MKNRIISLLVMWLVMHNLVAMEQSLCYQNPDQIKHYKNNSSLQFLWATDLLSRYQWEGNEVVLDVGCGVGNVAEFILERVPNGRILAIDASQEMINEAEKTYSEENFNKITFVSCSIIDIMLENMFEVAFSGCCLHWLSDQDHRFALKKINNALVPGGIFLMVGPGSNEYGVFALAKALSQFEKWAEDFANFVCPRSYYTKKEYHELLVQTGFEVVEVTETTTQKRYENRKELANWIIGCSPYVNHLHGDQCQKFLDDLIHEVLKYSPEDCDGSIMLNSIKLKVIAKRPKHEE